jgi:hypothetical protein
MYMTSSLPLDSPSDSARSNETHILRVTFTDHIATLHAKISSGALYLALTGHASE